MIKNLFYCISGLLLAACHRVRPPSQLDRYAWYAWGKGRQAWGLGQERVREIHQTSRIVLACSYMFIDCPTNVII